MGNPFIGALPLVASAIGRKYGVKVVIGSDKAATDGSVIYLPALPLESTSDMVNMARGYVDHEAAHIRETDFDLVRASRLSPVERHVWNIIEDYRIERVFGERYPGCRTNFEWLVLRFFDVETPPSETPEMTALNWLLTVVRSWSASRIGPRTIPLAEAMEKDLPGLRAKLSVVRGEIKADCPDTGAAIEFARKIVGIIGDHAERDEGAYRQEGGRERDESDRKAEDGDGSDGPEGLGDEGKPAGAFGGKEGRSGKDSALKSLLAKGERELPESLESLMESRLGEMSREAGAGGTVIVGEPVDVSIGELSDGQVAEARSVSAILKSRLLGKLQGLTIKPSRSGYKGRLDPNLVHRIPLGSTKVFRAKGARDGLDVAVHLLLDASGSMDGHIGLASTAVFSVCEALSGVRGVNVAATAFPGGPPKRTSRRSNSGFDLSTVAPLLKHGQRTHRRFAVKASGNTPLAQAIWYATKEMSFLRESRRIMLVMTDGEPDSVEDALSAVKSAQNLGIELYGLGLGDGSVKIILPGRSEVLANLGDLPGKLFKLLGRAFQIGR